MEKLANTSKSRAEDLSGQTFGRLTAIRRVPAPEGSDGRVRWLCKCTCGNECVVLAVNLKSGHTTSCGCRKLRNDLAGQHIGMLTVLERSDKFATRGARRVQLWKCRCDCGNITYKATDTLTNSQENSCWPCACKRNAANAIKSAGFEDGTQTYKIIYDNPPCRMTASAGVCTTTRSGICTKRPSRFAASAFAWDIFASLRTR